MALGRLLDGSRRAGKLEAVAVADASGCLVAGSGAFRSCEELAALAPLVLPERRLPAANDVVPDRLDVLARRIEVRRLTIDGVEVLVCGSGSDAEALGSALDHAASGSKRILGEPTR